MAVYSRCSGIVWWRCLSFMVLIIALLAASGGHAQAPSAGGQVLTPESSNEKPGDIGVRAHTNIEIFRPNRGADGGQAPPGGVPGGAQLLPPQPPGTEGVGSGARPQ
jgi:hypothetical protein